MLSSPNPRASFDRLQYTLDSSLKNIELEFKHNKFKKKLYSSLINNDLFWIQDEFVQELYDRDYKLFIFKNDSLVFWNSEKDLSFQNINKFKSDHSFAFLEVESGLFRIEVVYPVISSRTQLINPALVDNSNSNFDFKHVSRPTAYQLVINDDVQFYYLEPVKSRRAKILSGIVFLLYGISLLFFLLHYSEIIINHANENNKLKSIIGYLMGMIALRFSINLLIPKSFNAELILFSSSNSFAFYDSIVDFIILSLFIFIAIISMNRILTNNPISLKKSKFYWLIPFQLSIIIGFFLIVSACHGLVLETNMHFNVEEIYNIDKYSLLSITAVLFILFSLFNYSLLFIQYTNRFGISGLEKIVILLIAFILSIPIFYVLELNISVYIIYGFILIYFLLLDLYSDNNKLNIIWLIWWMIVFSGFTSVVFYNYSLDKEILQRKKLAQSLYSPMANEDIAFMSNLNDKIVKDDLMSIVLGLDTGNVSIHQFDLIQYFNEKLNINRPIQIESFRNDGSTILSKHYLNEERYISSFILLDTISNTLFYDPFLGRYLLKYRNLENGNVKSGISYLSYDTKNGEFDKIVRKNFKNNDKASLQILQGSKKLYVVGGFDFVDFIVGNEEQNGIKSKFGDGRLDICLFAPNEIKIVINKKIANIIKPISFFSYIFSLIGLLILFILGINYFNNFLPININFDIKHSLRSKIQFTLLIMIVVSFVLVGVVTSYYFNNLIKEDQLHNINQRTSILLNDISLSIKNTNQKKEAIDILKEKISDFAQTHNVELLLFSEDGKMLNTSEMDINGALFNYPIWFEFNRNIALKKSIKNEIMDGNWKSHIPIYFKNKYIASFEVKHVKLNVMTNSILEFFSTLLNVYVFLFLLAVFIAIAVSNSITSPLKLLANKIIDIKLGKRNDSIEWTGSDEIGLLIKNYNAMLTKIDNSAQLLAKTQRDQAWREMAKQVAHEIKNPLTPMKLSMQYLEKMVSSNPQRASELIPRISRTLIEQIDNLTGIANAFSNFAKMPKATNAKVKLNDVVETTHDLFRERDDMVIQLIEPIDDIFVFADKNHMVRILNNLLKNAMQAIPEDKLGKVIIELYKNNANAVIKVTDNGTGISDDMKDKVFTPNFTTKSSGTGLGLPIVANMIETFNGKIYFETEVNVGTSFYVEIPLMRSQNMEEVGERVSLD